MITDYDQYIANDKKQLFEIIYVSRKYKIKKTIHLRIPDTNFYLSICNVNIDKENIYVVTSNGSGINIAHRQKHIKAIYSLSKEKNIIYAGDTNILDSNQDKIIGKEKGWYDAWEECGTIKDKFTYTSDNPLVTLNIHSRPDRILYHPDKGKKLECEDFSLYGNDSDENISSHYGVLCTFSLS